MLRTIYICDPEKNKECSKTSCHFNFMSLFDECMCTTKKEYAQVDEKGEPIIYAQWWEPTEETLEEED